MKHFVKKVFLIGFTMFLSVLYAQESKLSFSEKEYNKPTSKDGEFVLVGDVGGTWTRFALCEFAKEKCKINFTMHFKSGEITDFAPVVKQVIEYANEKYSVSVECASFAVAGPVSGKRDFCPLTNLFWDIDAKKVLELTKLKSAVLLNDFEAIGYGVEAIDSKNLIDISWSKDVVANRDKDAHFNKVVIGAGTGLGKCVLVWDVLLQQYRVVSSEGGHADFAVHTKEEFVLKEFVSKNVCDNAPVRWEDMLSGRGIQSIYTFLEYSGEYESTPCAKEIKESGYDAGVIAQHKDKDACCRTTFDMFAKIYGRAAKNFALEELAVGGVYIAGGIAAKNLDIFKKETFDFEFLNNRTHRKSILEKTPVFVVTDEDVGLYGAAVFAQLMKKQAEL